MKPLILIFLLFLAGCVSHAPVTSGIPNLRQVDPGLYRGGQPTYAGFEFLKNIGVSNIIKLNSESEGSDIPARVLHMEINAYPISITEQLLKTPSDKVFAAVDHIKPGTFLHCEHGQDRTGIAIAVYRVRHDGWTKARAEQEMLDLGFHKSLHGLWDWWEDWKP